jgi:hypothetical protein
MTLSAAAFVLLSTPELEGFAVDQARAQGLEIPPPLFRETIENLAALQAHASIFLSSPEAPGPGSDGAA